MKILLYFIFFLIVNGNWGDWMSWSTCSVTCGTGNQTRTRACDNPPPQYEGTHCNVDGSAADQSQQCQNGPCPGKWFVLFIMKSLCN